MRWRFISEAQTLVEVTIGIVTRTSARLEPTPLFSVRPLAEIEVRPTRSTTVRRTWRRWKEFSPFWTLHNRSEQKQPVPRSPNKTDMSAVAR